MLSKINTTIICTIIFLIIFGMLQQVYAISDSCRCVAFRLDDVQDYYLNNVQMEIINTFEQNHQSLTVGIIGNYFGNDKIIVNVLREKLKENDTSLEIANHGWNHEDFTLFNKTEQAHLVKKTNEKIFEILRVSPTGFIPPFNKINTDTIDILRENKIQYFSANVTQDLPPYDMENASIYHLPATSFTGDLNEENSYWFGTTHKETFAQIQSSLMKHGFAVVTLHPQEYSKRDGLNFSNEVDQSQIRELEMLINDIENSALDIVTISEIPNHYIGYQKTPAWIKQIFTWYETKQISTNEVNNAIKFLIENKIIKFNS